MKILVCVKQVPDMGCDFRVNAECAGYEEDGLVWRMNSYDEYALEEAVRIKERFGEVEITALTVGPARSEAAARRAIECGADRAAHILTTDGQRLDALQTASCIAYYARDRNFILSLFGVMSEDEQRCQTGPMFASIMRRPCVTTVIKTNLADDFSSMRAERELEGGRRDLLETTLPAVITVQSGINEPRYPTLTNKLRARKQGIELIKFDDIPQTAACEKREKIFKPPQAEKAVFLEGVLEKQARDLVDIIYGKLSVF